MPTPEVSPQVLLTDLLSGDDARAEQAAQAIGALGQLALALIKPLCTSANADHRWWAARTLRELHGEDAYQALIDLLSDADPDVRACSAFALGEGQIAQAVEPLAGLLGDSSV